MFKKSDVLFRSKLGQFPLPSPLPHFMLLVLPIVFVVSAASSAYSVLKDSWVLIPAGQFIMGSTHQDINVFTTLCRTDCSSKAGDMMGDVEALRLCRGQCKPEMFDNETPMHHVYVDDYYVSRFLVTNAEYLDFVRATGRPAPRNESRSIYTLWNGSTVPKEILDHPVINVSWYDARAYCRWVGGRLPTEAEWEKASRGPDGFRYPWGNETPTLSHANYGKSWDGSETLTPVGYYEKGKSPYGIYDMSGNVWQWTNDWYAEHYYDVSPKKNPKGPKRGRNKTVRGGSWINIPAVIHSASRVGYDPLNRIYDIGIRCAKDPKS